MTKITFLLFIALALLAFYSCANGQVKKEYYENGNLKTVTRYKDDLKNGEEKNYYRNGELADVFTYVAGIKEGPYYVYYKNGNLNRTGVFINGKLNGLYVELTESGDTIFKREYLDDQTQLDILYEENRPFRILDPVHKWMTIYNEDGTVKDSIPIKGWD